MAAMTAAQIAQKWATAMSAAGPSIEAGVNGVTTAPGQLAAAAGAKWLARVTASQAKFEQNVGSVTLAQWKAAALAGIPKVGTGATNAIPKFTAFMTSFLAYLEANAATIKAMPTDTFDQAMQKAYAQALYNHNYPGYR